MACDFSKLQSVTVEEPQRHSQHRQQGGDFSHRGPGIENRAGSTQAPASNGLIMVLSLLP